MKQVCLYQWNARMEALVGNLEQPRPLTMSRIDSKVEIKGCDGGKRLLLKPRGKPCLTARAYRISCGAAASIASHVLIKSTQKYWKHVALRTHGNEPVGGLRADRVKEQLRVSLASLR